MKLKKLCFDRYKKFYFGLTYLDSGLRTTILTPVENNDNECFFIPIPCSLIHGLDVDGRPAIDLKYRISK